MPGDNFKYELNLIGNNTEVSVKSYLPELDIPKLDQWDDYPGDYIDEFVAQNINGGFLFVELVEKNQKNITSEGHEEFPLSDILEVDSREVLLMDEPEEWFKDKVLCRIGEGKGGLGSAFLELEEPFNIKKVFITSVETSYGDFMEKIFYDGKQIVLDDMDINFGSFSMQVNLKYRSEKDWDYSSRIESSVKEFLEDKPLWFEDS
jgi:hypothetical protein